MKVQQFCDRERALLIDFKKHWLSQPRETFPRDLSEAEWLGQFTAWVNDDSTKPVDTHASRS